MLNRDNTFWSNYGFLIPSVSTGIFTGIPLGFYGWNKCYDTRTRLIAMSVFGIGIGISLCIGFVMAPVDAYDDFRGSFSFIVSIPLITAMITAFSVVLVGFLITNIITSIKHTYYKYKPCRIDYLLFSNHVDRLPYLLEKISSLDQRNF